MCKTNDINTLMSFPFVGVSKEVENALLSWIQEVELDSRHSYVTVLYTWYLQRGNYRDGMFQSVLVAFMLTFNHFSCTCHVSAIRAVGLSCK